MTAKSVVSAGIGAIASAALLLVVSLAGAPSAQAQIEEPDPDELACFVHEELLLAGEAQCDALGCDPSEGDCDKLCKNARKGCEKAGRAFAKVLKEFGKSATKNAKILCGTADDKRSCKSAVKEIDKILRDATKELQSQTKAACNDQGIQDDCSASCNLGAAFPGPACV